MVLFAADIGGWIKIAVFLVGFGVWAINQVLARRRGQDDDSDRTQEDPKEVRAGGNRMEPQDIDQFLDEVLGRGRKAGPAIQGQAGDPTAKVVVLRPGNPPPQPGARPGQAARRPAQQIRIRPPRPPAMARPAAPQPSATPARSSFSQSVQQDVDKAAAATHDAAELRVDAKVIGPSRVELELAAIRSMLKSPADLRRAMLLREIIGSPLAHRTRHLGHRK